jgi:pimeloyl-ACP methyl ester carboxylesterase
LAAHGIASLRYDKRGIGESAKALVSESNLRFEMGADDAAAWVNMLRPDARFSTITIVGHSEGSLLGLLAAQRAPVDGYVSIAGAGFPAADLLRQQLAKQLPPRLLEIANTTLDTLVAGRTVASPPPQLASLFRPSVQPYLISWFKVDPRAEIARLTIPTLIIQGTSDIQVTEADARSLAKAQPAAKLVIIDGMNHVFKQVGSDAALQQSSYSDPSLPDSPKLIDTLTDFVKSVPRHR